MIKQVFFAIAFALLSINSQAKEMSYEADVKGMVCAFCAYNVSKNISALPGVDADSVNVDLKGGHVAFNSSQVVSEDKLAALFTRSGFTVSNLKETRLDAAGKQPENPIPLLSIEVDPEKVEQYHSVFEAVGNIAASTPSRLVITAPPSYEEKLLKPILMGRQQDIKVRYVAGKSAKIRVRLFEY